MQPMLNRDEMLDEALAYRDRGFSVIPVLQCDGKKAATDWKVYQSQAADTKQVIDWFANDRRNVAIVTGAVSGVLVLDVDNVDGLKGYPALPETPTVKTGKGMHVYFKHPGFEVGNMAVQGLGDIRADKGYVIAPPSLHQSGKRYTWEQSLDDVPLAPVPEWLLKLITTKAKLAGNDNDEIKTTNYGKAWFDDVEVLARETAGGRNNSLNIVACKAGNLIASSQLNENEAKDALFLACKRNALVQDDGAESVLATIRSGIRAGMNNPRYPEDNPLEALMPTIKGGKLIFRKASEIEPEKIDWLWQGVLAKGHIALIAGDPGTGKSQVSLSLASVVSNGGYWPASKQPCAPGNVIIISCEDRAEDVIVPRLMAAGANLDRVLILDNIREDESEREFRLKEDMPLLREACAALGDVSLIIIDPISSYMNGGDMNQAKDVRPITNELAKLASDHMASVVMITHNSKGNGTSAGGKVTGSHTWLASARTSFSVTKDEETGIRTMAPIKANITKDTDAFSFTVKDSIVPCRSGEIETSFVAWENASHKRTANQVLADQA